MFFFVCEDLSELRFPKFFKGIPNEADLIEAFDFVGVSGYLSFEYLLDEYKKLAKEEPTSLAQKYFEDQTVEDF